MGRAQMAGFHKPVTKRRQKPAMVGANAVVENSFGGGLAVAARSIIADARSSLASPELSDAEAVHEVIHAIQAAQHGATGG